MAASMSMAGCSSASAPMKNFKPLPKTILALGEAVPWRPGGIPIPSGKRTSKAKEQTMLLTRFLRFKKLIASNETNKIFSEMEASVSIEDCSPAPASAPIEKIVASRYGRV